jgi:hypothetical protein
MMLCLCLLLASFFLMHCSCFVFNHASGLHIVPSMLFQRTQLLLRMQQALQCTNWQNPVNPISRLLMRLGATLVGSFRKETTQDNPEWSSRIICNTFSLVFEAGYRINLFRSVGSPSASCQLWLLRTIIECDRMIGRSHTQNYKSLIV